MKIGKCLVVALCCGLPLSACHKEAPPPCQNLPVKADEQTLAVQRALADRHYDVGVMNGTMNSQTLAALQTFQKDTGLPQSGQADAKTLDALGFCPVVAPPVDNSTPTRDCTEFPAPQCQQVVTVQQILNEREYDPGPVDGVMGRKTRGALKRFQTDKGLKKTGKIDGATREALGFCVPPTDKPASAKPAGDKSTGAKSTDNKSTDNKSTGNKSTGAKATAASPRPVADPQLQEVQRELAARGYDPGPANGLMNKKTREALKRFQTDNDFLAPSGSVDAQTLGALRAAAPGKTPLNPSKADEAVPATEVHEGNAPAPASTTPATDSAANPPPSTEKTADGPATPPPSVLAPEPSTPPSSSTH